MSKKKMPLADLKGLLLKLWARDPERVFMLHELMVVFATTRNRREQHSMFLSAIAKRYPWRMADAMSAIGAAS